MQHFPIQFSDYLHKQVYPAKLNLKHGRNGNSMKNCWYINRIRMKNWYKLHLRLQITWISYEKYFPTFICNIFFCFLTFTKHEKSWNSLQSSRERRKEKWDDKEKPKNFPFLYSIFYFYILFFYVDAVISGACQSRYERGMSCLCFEF